MMVQLPANGLGALVVDVDADGDLRPSPTRVCQVDIWLNDGSGRLTAPLVSAGGPLPAGHTWS